MTDNIRLPDELGAKLRQRRESLGMSKSELADRAGKVREVVYRLEAGEDVTISSLLAVLGALRMVIHLEPQPVYHQPPRWHDASKMKTKASLLPSKKDPMR
jgi:transcriptional regulator with XRE-family HTH domain